MNIKIGHEVIHKLRPDWGRGVVIDIDGAQRVTIIFFGGVKRCVQLEQPDGGRLLQLTEGDQTRRHIDKIFPDTIFSSEIDCILGSAEGEFLALFPQFSEEAINTLELFRVISSLGFEILAQSLIDNLGPCRDILECKEGSLGDNLYFPGSIDVPGDLTIAGDVLVGQSLRAASNLRVDGSLKVGDSLHVSKNLHGSLITTGEELEVHGNIVTTGRLKVGSYLYCEGDIFCDHVIEVKGILDSRGSVTGKFNIHADSISVGGDLNCGSRVYVASAMDVRGTTNSAGGVSAERDRPAFDAMENDAEAERLQSEYDARQEEGLPYADAGLRSFTRS